MKNFLFILLFFCGFSVVGQYNFLGKSQTYIEEYYRKNAKYYLKIDTLTRHNILLTFKSYFQYPYYTYEIDLVSNNCISFGLVSKESDVLHTYLDFLNFTGILVRKDTINHCKIYEVKQGTTLRFYDIKQPYLEDQNINRRSLFYILVRDRRLELGDY